jgi:hypothetical protein
VRLRPAVPRHPLRREFVISSGGLIRGVGAELLGWSDALIRERIDAIGDTLGDIYRRADADGITTHEAALQIARASAIVERVML